MRNEHGDRPRQWSRNLNGVNEKFMEFCFHDSSCSSVDENFDTKFVAHRLCGNEKCEKLPDDEQEKSSRSLNFNEWK